MAPNLDRNDGHTNEAFEADADSLKKIDDTSSSSSASTDPKKKKKDDKKKKKKEEEDEKNKPTIPDVPPVSFFSLFRFASGTDYLLIIIAILAAAGTGVCFPIMLILFGDVTNAFVGRGFSPEDLYNFQCNESWIIELNTTGYSNHNNLFSSPKFQSKTTFLRFPAPDPQALMDEFTKFGMYTSIIGAVLFVLGFIFVTSLNFTAENQVCKPYFFFFNI